MRVETQIRDFSLRLISILVWFMILWASVFLIGLVFRWSGITDQFVAAFFGSGFCVILVLAALALLNMTANLNIISQAQVAQAGGAAVSEAKAGTRFTSIGLAAVLIGVVVLSLWFAEWRGYRDARLEVSAELDSLADTTLAQQAVHLIKADAKVDELAKARDALSNNIQSAHRLSILYPENVYDVEVYHELSDGSDQIQYTDKTISDAGLPKFVPSADERRQFDQLKNGEITGFTATQGDSLRAFRLVQTSEGKMILLLESARRYK